MCARARGSPPDAAACARLRRPGPPALARKGLTSTASSVSLSTPGGGGAGVTVVGNRLLLVDDSELTARMLTRLLTRAGFACEHAANGRVAVDLWRQEAAAGRHFDATLMDKVGAAAAAAAVAAARARQADGRRV
jgi:hypothetical protein